MFYFIEIANKMLLTISNKAFSITLNELLKLRLKKLRYFCLQNLCKYLIIDKVSVLMFVEKREREH